MISTCSRHKRPPSSVAASSSKKSRPHWVERSRSGKTHLDAPGFKRLVLTRGDEGLVIDLVKDVSPQLHRDKLERNNIVIDPADEILANKLTALVGRAEERDLVDVMFLENAGFTVEAGLPVALSKDGGCTPATLAWLLSEISISDDVHLPANVPPTEMRAYLAELINRLLALAAPP
jgi:hypothetical protein